MTQAFINAFRIISGLRQAEIIMRCFNSPLENEILYRFFVHYGRFPNDAEEAMLFDIGFVNFQALHRCGVATA